MDSLFIVDPAFGLFTISSGANCSLRVTTIRLAFDTPAAQASDANYFFRARKS